MGRVKLLVMRVFAVLENTDISASTLFHYLENLRKPDHDLTIVYTYYYEEETAMVELEKVKEKLSQKYGLPSDQYSIIMGYFSIKANRKDKKEHIDRKITEGMLKTATALITEHKPDKIVFACRGYLRLRSIINDFEPFQKAANLIAYEKCSDDLITESKPKF